MTKEMQAYKNEIAYGHQIAHDMQRAFADVQECLRTGHRPAGRRPSFVKLVRKLIPST